MPQISITVHLHTVLQRLTSEGRVSKLQINAVRGATIASVMQELEIPLDEENLLLVINGRLTDPKMVLQDGDELHLIPAISGG